MYFINKMVVSLKCLIRTLFICRSPLFLEIVMVMIDITCIGNRTLFCPIQSVIIHINMEQIRLPVHGHVTVHTVHDAYNVPLMQPQFMAADGQ